LAASWSKDSSLLKSLGKAKAAPQPMLNLDFSVVELMVANGDDRKREIAQKVFGQSIVGRDRVSLTLSGGNELKAKVVLKGGALQYAVAMSQAKK
jgi:hypothetical protein